MSRRLVRSLLSSWASPQSNSSQLIHLVPDRTFSASSVQNTWVLKRQNQLPLTDLSNQHRRRLNFRDQVYDTVECRHEKATPPIQLLLLQNVPGHGRAGDVVTVRRNIARMFLLPEGKAQYVTPEGIAAFEARKQAASMQPEMQSSSAISMRTVEYFQNMILNVPMNMHNPWKLERWHVRSALRLNGVWCPNDDVIELPEQEISGPHPEMHGKCFSVFVTINGKERGCLLCRIELRCKDPADALPVLDCRLGKPILFEPLFDGAVSDSNQPPNVKPRPKSAGKVQRRWRVKDF